MYIAPLRRIVKLPSVQVRGSATAGAKSDGLAAATAAATANARSNAQNMSKCWPPWMKIMVFGVWIPIGITQYLLWNRQGETMQEWAATEAKLRLEKEGFKYYDQSVKA